MAYLEEFRLQVENQDLPRLFKLWEEYCQGDEIDAEEFISILEVLKNSRLANSFGEYIETALPLWSKVTDEEANEKVLALIYDLQTTNSPLLADTAIDYLKNKYKGDENFNEKIRLVGLRNRDHFEGAISNFILLSHIAVGKFVYHTSGWGTGEIVDLSLVREELIIEFENVVGRKDVSFKNAFKTLVPLNEDGFLAKRFGDPDSLEVEAKKDPISVVKLLLKDLGPLTAAEIKTELCELVIPERDWTKWWQNVRSKIKKNKMIASPATIRKPFFLRDSEIGHSDRLKSILAEVSDPESIIQVSYNFIRNVAESLKEEQIINFLKEKLIEIHNTPSSTPALKAQTSIFIDLLIGKNNEVSPLSEIVQTSTNLLQLIDQIQIVAFKKRILIAIRENRSDWPELFLEILFEIKQSTLKDYLLKELNQTKTREKLEEAVQKLLDFPTGYPEAFVWYFQKVIADKTIPYSKKEDLCLFLENLMVLLHYLEFRPEYRDLAKKIYSIISGNRYSVVREIIKDTEKPFLREFLLLASKCQSLSDHDQTILNNLAEVVQPTLNGSKKDKSEELESVLWTTEAGYQKTQERIKQIGTVEVIENAKEIEKARALGDLKENSEFKYAQERRAQLQSELKRLSDDFQKARILTKEDIDISKVGIGTVVDLVNESSGEKNSYTILGPWDADPNAKILSNLSPFVKEMKGLKEGETFTFRNETFRVEGLKSYLEVASPKS